MANDPVLFKLRDPCELTDFRVQFRKGQDRVASSLIIDDGEVRLSFANPDPLNHAVSLVTENPSDVIVYDAHSAQRETQRVRVGFFNDESQYFEFWADSVKEVSRE